MSEQQEFSFKHTNLKDIDPSMKPVDEGFYTLQLSRVFDGTFEQKPTFRNGNPNPNYIDGGDNTVEYISLSFTITDHEEHSGRRVNTFLSASENAKKQLAILMAAVGVEQEDGEEPVDYLKRLAELNPPAPFKCLVKQKNGTDREGNPEVQNVAVLWQAQSL